uniref:Uncharacterized protein n=1 Tax=Syphacia muris TaxID=451379 RepID=A0A0N5AX24_9BILA
MRFLTLTALALIIIAANAYPKTSIEDSNKNGRISSKSEIKKVRGSSAYLKQKTKMPLKEKKQKDGIRTLKFKKVRRVGPPFNEYLKGAERLELLELIKTARAVGKTQDEVRETIDFYLKSHLSAEKLAEVEKLKTEGAQREQERARQMQQRLTETEQQNIRENIDDQFDESKPIVKYRSSSRFSR